MLMTLRQRLVITAMVGACAAPMAASSQQTVTIVPGPDYEAGQLKRTLLGDGWRSIWLTPVNVPVFDIGTYAGGLKVKEKGGGNQTRTLRFSTSDGRESLFRSVNKFPVGQAMPEPVQNSTLGDIVQDQVSTLFPAGGLMIPALLEALSSTYATSALADARPSSRHTELERGILLQVLEQSPAPLVWEAVERGLELADRPETRQVAVMLLIGRGTARELPLLMRVT